jgi:hypothetical protein
LTLLAIIIQKWRPYTSPLSLTLLVSSFILLLMMAIIPFLKIYLKTYRYILEYITAPVSVVTVLFDAFLVKPYFREVAKTGNELRDNINIKEVTVKDVEGKERSRISFCGSVIQCSLRLRSEHFAVPIYARNAIGWVALINKINKARSIELHAGYAPWGYSHHYVLDIVGEESLILFFIPCANMQCGDLAKQLRDCLSGRGCGLKSIDIMFPVRPAEITRNWDRGIAVEFQVPINELKNLRLKVRAGGENTTIYEDKFKLRKVITSCIDDYLRTN